MDTHNERTMATEQLRAQIGGRKVIAGAKQLRKALMAKSVRCVYLARNADPAITEPIMALCKEHLVPYVWARSMTDLGTACGIEVGAAAAATLN